MHVVQISHQNPDASMPLIMPVLVLPNTPVDVVDAQIRANGALDLPWLRSTPPHDGIAILCGGGPSIKRQTAKIRDLTRKKGATLFGLNACAGWLVDNQFDVDIQTILDAKQETANLVETMAHRHIFASQCHPDTIDRLIRSRSRSLTLFHLNNTDIEDLLPDERVKRGGYVLIGGGVSVGITSMVMAYAMGYREMHFFGYDSSNESGATHAYRQDMNQFVPNIDVEWGDKTYNASMPMKQQAEAFPRFARELQAEGVEINVYGDGLLQAMWREPPRERQKYKLLWGDKAYRIKSFGEVIVPVFLERAKPDSTVIDFGCGTGRG
ncbi:MAG: DUF115 domain-containing protein, partial [Proteobacteria bacterium]|nr:DUF115 domain-containing protein [Pseudomonadota bacterium]